MKTYINKANSLFAPCSNPEQKLVDAALFFMEYMIDAERNAVALAASLLKIDEQERRERPDLGTRGHDTVPVPNPAVGANTWTDPTAWRANPSRPTT